MAKVPIVVWGTPWGFTAATTTFVPLATAELNANSNENRRYVLYREAGVFSDLFIRVTANTTTANSVIKTRKNATTDGNLSVTIASGGTGEFEDTSNTDTSAAGDKWAIQVAAGATGTALTVSILSCKFAATTNTASKFALFVAAITATTTTYFALTGLSSAGDATESNIKNRVTAGGGFTAKNMYLRVVSNTKAGNTPVRIRKNGADGTVVATITSSGTGDFEDTTHSDTLASGDDVDIALEASVSGTLTPALFAVTAQSSTDDGWLLGAANSALTVVEPATRYFGMGGGLRTNISSETETQLKTGESRRYFDLTIHISANTINATSTFTLRKNAADTACLCSITTNATGYFTDGTNEEVCDADDLVNYAMVTPAVSGSQTMTVRSMGCITEPAAAVNNVVKTMPTETITITQAAFSRLAAKMRPIATETTSLSDSRTRLSAKNRALATQTTTIGVGTAARVKGKQKILTTETITVSENRARLGTKQRPIATQSTTLSDSVARVKTPFGGGPADMSEIAAKTYANKFITKV